MATWATPRISDLYPYPRAALCAARTCRLPSDMALLSVHLSV
jgi:hypothetical protein